MILMLEDDPDRLRRFAAVVRSIDPGLPLVTWRSAHRMIAEVAPLLPRARLISLDHDLEPEPGAPDPGDGYMVAKWLTAQGIIRPVIVHSSNGERSSWMAGEFDLAGWLQSFSAMPSVGSLSQIQISCPRPEISGVEI